MTVKDMKASKDASHDVPLCGRLVAVFATRMQPDQTSFMR